MKEPIKKKIYSEEKKREIMLRERIERQNEILKNRSEGLQQWTKEHASAELVFDCVMNALDSVSKEDKKALVRSLRFPILEFDLNHTDYLAYENDIDSMDAVFEMLREIHDIIAKEVGLESYKEFLDKINELEKKLRGKRRRSRKKETVEDLDFKTSEGVDDLPF